MKYIRELRMDPKIRLTTKTTTNGNGCWIFNGALGKDGYGIFKLNGKTIAAHRASFLLLKGEIPDGLSVLHTCDVPACINPEHLKLGTQNDNLNDAISKGRRSPKKLTQEDADYIKLFTNNSFNKKRLAKQFSCSQMLVDLVMRGERWT